MEFNIFLKSSLFLTSFLLSLLFLNKTLGLNNLKSKTAKNAKISVFFICVETIIYLLLYNLHDCNFKSKTNPSFAVKLAEGSSHSFLLSI